MSMLIGAFARLTRYVVAVTAAALLIAAPTAAHADDIAPTPEPSATAAEPTLSPETDSTGTVPGVPDDVSVPVSPSLPESSALDTLVGLEQTAHMGGM
ncbi:hypothetical protein [Nonomuraea sp. NPDC049784]|uniref:hypothetical protein n=1 Tax=Nonomuraea sp. NPDC049784 TaxID=3154361 RepID=UPI003404AA1A